MRPQSAIGVPKIPSSYTHADYRTDAPPVDEEGFAKSGTVDHKYAAYVMLNFWIVLAENGDVMLTLTIRMKFLVCFWHAYAPKADPRR